MRWAKGPAVKHARPLVHTCACTACNPWAQGSDEGAAQHSGGPGGGPIDFGMQRDVEAGSSWDQDGVSKHWQAPL